MKQRRAAGARKIDGALLDVEHGAAFLGISKRALPARVARHQIPFRKMGRRVVFVRRELEKYIEALEGCPLSEALENVSRRDWSDVFPDRPRRAG